MIDIVLGIIALASLTTLVVEVSFAVMLVRTTVRIKARVERMARSARLLRAHAEAIASDVEKTKRLALRQIGHVQDVHATTMVALRPLITMVGIGRSLAAVLANRRARRP